jgi:hypothetical protein
VAHVDHARHGVLVDPLHRRHRVILERPEDVADRDVHLAAGLDVLEHDHAALFEQIVELLADRLVLERCERHAGNACTERQIIPQRCLRQLVHDGAPCCP